MTASVVSTARSVAAIRAAIQEAADEGRINRWATPERIVLADALEKTSVGKIDKKRLRACYAAPRGAVAGNEPPDVRMSRPGSSVYT